MKYKRNTESLKNEEKPLQDIGSGSSSWFEPVPEQGPTGVPPKLFIRIQRDRNPMYIKIKQFRFRFFFIWHFQ